MVPEELIEARASETILQRGVRVKVLAPLLLRMFGKKHVTVTLRQPTGGALLRMGYWLLICQISIDKLEEISVEDALLLKVKHGDNIYRALACLLLVGKIRTRLFLKPFANWLKESLPPTEALRLLQLALLYGGLDDFMTTTRLIRAKTITLPRLGQKTRRS